LGQGNLFEAKYWHTGKELAEFEKPVDWPLFEAKKLRAQPKRLEYRDCSALSERQGLPREDGVHGMKHTEALLARGVQIGPDHTEILSADEGTKAARYSLLDLGHPDGALSQIIGERDGEVVHKAQHLLFSLK
jgi:hypothetical protein